jgi:hypothetical protein
MPSDPIAGDPGHESVAIVHALSPAKYKGERNGVGKIARIGGRELVIVGHPRTIVDGLEHIKNEEAPRLVGLRGAKLAPLWEETGVNGFLQVRPTKRRDGGHIANKKGRTPKPPSGLLDRPAYVLGFLSALSRRLRTWPWQSLRAGALTPPAETLPDV